MKIDSENTTLHWRVALLARLLLEGLDDEDDAVMIAGDRLTVDNRCLDE